MPLKDCTFLSVPLFEFIAYLTGLNSNPSGSSDPWVAVRPSRVPGLGPRRSGRYSGIRAQGSNEIYNGLITMAVPKKGTSTLLACPCIVVSFPAESECELQESVDVVAGCTCFERGCWFAHAAVGFVLGLRVRVGVSRRLREHACGVAFTGAGLWSTEPSTSLLELSRCFVCHVAPLVESYNTCLWLLLALCWLVANSSEVLPEFFSVGSGGGEVFPKTVLCSFLVVAALPSGLRVEVRCCCAGHCVLVGFPQNGALVVLVEVLPEPVDREVGLVSHALWALPDGGLVSAMGVWLAVPLVGVLASRRGFLFRVRERPVVCLLPLLSVGCSGCWCFHMAFGAMSRTVATFVVKVPPLVLS
ncbi:hypothetical protein Taro_051466 [Colocasia esculenta]|uniref:Uncharacterized protein n=1 Tax=Colocasia esculenta TaxID=4460 RepID=A0A843XG23_COLES|nr:hypothetical protein [Colocasia esculenta]